MEAISVLILIAMLSYPFEEPHKPMSHAPGEAQVAVVCFKSGEQTSGMNKICYYDCMGSTAAITISSVQLCPLSINQ